MLANQNISNFTTLAILVIFCHIFTAHAEKQQFVTLRENSDNATIVRIFTNLNKHDLICQQQHETARNCPAVPVQGLLCSKVWILVRLYWYKLIWLVTSTLHWIHYKQICRAETWAQNSICMNRTRIYHKNKMQCYWRNKNVYMNSNSLFTMPIDSTQRSYKQ